MRQHFPLDPTTGAESQALLPWSDGVPQTGTPGSYPGHALVTDSEAEILAAVDAAGLARSGTDLTQLTQAMSIGLYLGAFGGTPNALTGAIKNNVSLPALLPGMKFNGLIGATANTGAGTLALSGFAAAPGLLPIVRRDGASILQAGDLSAGALATLFYDGASFRTIGLLPSEIVALIAANPSRRNSVTLSTVGTYAWNVPIGITAVYVQIWAGGGGGGGSGSANQAGGGGGAGGYIEAWIFIAPGVTQIPFAVGAGGLPGNGNTGAAATAGGSSAFAGLLSATGGQPGGTNNGAQGIGGNGIGTNGSSNAYASYVSGVFQASGGNGGNGGYLTSDTSTTYGGFGAPSYQQSLIPWTFGGPINGFGPGTGGTGGSRGTGAYLGGSGAPGLIRLSY